MASIPKSWILQVLAEDKFDSRFEAVANALVSLQENTAVVGTSVSWDLGRDGRSANSAHGIYVLASTRDDLEKPRKDAARLKNTTPGIRHVYVATSFAASEHFLNEARKAVQEEIGTEIQISILGATQLADLSEIDPRICAVFTAQYPSELEAIRAQLRPGGSHGVEQRSYQLALGTVTATGTSELRQELVDRMLLGLLDSKGPASPDALAALIHSEFGLKGLEAPLVQVASRRLEKKGQILVVGQNLEITTEGRARASKIREEQSTFEESGANRLRKTVEESLGRKLDNSHWSRIWKNLKTELASLFYRRGAELVDVVAAITSGRVDFKSRKAFREILTDGLATVAKQTTEAPQQEELCEALHLAFSPGDPGRAFDWFADLAGVFVAVCALGLSHDVYQAIEATLSKIRFAFDTDVVVSFLCRHEVEHDAATILFQLGRRLNRQPLIPSAVAEETARHAMKAHIDYSIQVANRQPLAWYELETLQSAFTREFEHMRLEGEVKREDWNRYVNAIAGPLERDRDGHLVPDTGRMRGILAHEGFLVMPAEMQGTGTASPLTDVFTAALRIRNEQARRRQNYEAGDQVEESDAIRRDKARGDAEVLVALSQAMRNSEADGTGERTVLLTNSAALRALPAQVRHILNPLPEVLTPIEAAFLATLLPSEPAGPGVLRGLLFEGEFRRKLDPIMGLLLRVVAQSRSARVPGASRGVLIRTFSDELLRTARADREPVRVVKERAMHDPSFFARLAAAAVDALSLQDPVDRDEVLSEIRNLADAETAKKHG